MDPRVETSSGWIAGAREGDVLVFRGIPYARPPQGALRLRAPLAPGAVDRRARGDAPSARRRPAEPPAASAALLGTPTEVLRRGLPLL